MDNLENDKIFTKVENEAEFPGGQKAWLKYIEHIIETNSNQFMKDNIHGSCVVEFVVDVKGNIGNVKATTMQGTRLAEEAVKALKKGPRWVPAKQNGHIVTSYKSVLVTFKLSDDDMRVVKEPN